MASSKAGAATVIERTPAQSAPRPLSPTKEATRRLADSVAAERKSWIARNRYYYEDHYRYMRFLVPKGSRVLDLGCGTGDLLAELEPSHAVGVDLSEAMIDIARREHPSYAFHVGDVEDPAVIAGLEGPFDVIILSDTIGSLEDIEATLYGLQPLCGPETRLVISYYSRGWEPLLKLAERMGTKQRQLPLNWLSTSDIAGLLSLADFEIIKREWRQLLPKRFLGLGPLVNGTLAPIPGIRRLCFRNYVVARSIIEKARPYRSATVLVPCRNERGNIEAAVQRTPQFCDDVEILFVEGHSADGTLEEIERVRDAYPDRDIKVFVQPGKGKGDAVRHGFANARGDVLMILDADLTMPPEALPKFYNALASGKGEFVNGTRLVYPMEQRAMRPLNLMANRTFSLVFSWLLNQRFTDTLCGTKALSREHYRRIAEGRDYFGSFDPFGDFDLLFGAAKANLKIVEIPIRYAERRYGAPQISRFRDGWYLLRMVAFAYRKLKIP